MGKAHIAELALVVGVFFCAACSEEVILLAEVPDGDNGPAGNISGARCMNTGDCNEGMFCERRDCSAPAGTCQPYPVSCGNDEHPVCGCDGITYWNDCLRRAAGVAGARPDECLIEGATCLDSSGCADGAVCAKLSGFGGPAKPMCHGPVPGRCWVLPATCPPPSRVDRWDECAPVEDALHCLDTCSAIRSERPFSRAALCE